MPPYSKGKTLYNPINKLTSKLFCGHALIYFFSFFGFQKKFLVILDEMNLILGPVQTPTFS